MKKMAILTIAMLVMVAVLATVVNANTVAGISTDKAKYEQGLARLRDKFGEKTVAYPFTIKDKDETTGLRNPNDYPLNLS